LYAALRDTVAPRLVFPNPPDPTQPMRNVRPRIEGRLSDNGSGIATDSVALLIDGVPGLGLADLRPDGLLVLQPREALGEGLHTFQVRVADRAGNVTEGPRLQVLVKPPLALAEIVNFPNPARHRTVIRISGNRSDLAAGGLSVRILDTAGHTVRWLDTLAPATAMGSRFVLDLPWDLTNEDGERVANGVYLARVELLDPDDPTRKTRQTRKIAVLR